MSNSCTSLIGSHSSWKYSVLHQHCNNRSHKKASCPSHCFWPTQLPKCYVQGCQILCSSATRFGFCSQRVRAD
uniref:Uncharacterized protein n=1 Tax=Arundo donax TaxID=35708 RepID=A0A0A9AF46_ARUDO